MTRSEKINIGLMAIYVFATIFICIFNGLSANASKKQLEESQKQFKEMNTAQVMITFKFISSMFFAFVISNTGNSYAKNVKIRCSQNIIDASKEETKFCLKELCKSVFVLAPKQEFTLLLFKENIENLFEHIVDFYISYESEDSEFNSKISIDLSQYAWTINLQSEKERFLEKILDVENDIFFEYKHLNHSLNTLNNSLKYLNKNLSTQSIKFLEFVKEYSNKQKINLNTEHIVKIRNEEIFSKISNPLIICNILEELIFYNFITNDSCVIDHYTNIYFTLDGIQFLNKISKILL